MTIIAQFALPADTAKKIHDTLVDCISNEETRHYLNGVALQNNAELGLIAVATDGHKAGIYRLRLQSDQELKALPADLSVILPREAVKWLGAVDFKAKDSNFVVFTLTAKTVKMAFVGGGEATFDLIEGTFPDWQRFGNYHYADKNAPTICLSADYIIQLAKALKKEVKMRTTQVRIHVQDGNSPCYLSQGNDLRFFLMPMRD